MQRFLGEGGRKRVYLAHDTKLDRDVAFAVIKTEGLDADGLVRVRREAQAMGRLGDHPHIVTIHDVGEEDGQQYIVSQYMAGGSVEDLLAKAPAHKLAIDEACGIAEETCRALEHAHSRGIIHRDLKPGNVWLTAEGTAQLGDFGLAVALDRSRMTMAGMMVGTVAYMAPEQALGRQPDARSDLYSLGAMLFELVAGCPPFLGDDAIGIISQHINTAAVAPSWHNAEVPKPLDTLILRLLAKSPDDRPANAAEVAAEVRRILARSTEEPVAQEPQVVTDLRNLNWGRFVGRHEEMEQLRAALDAMLSGSQALAMIAGEPGIGKTRLAEEFAVYAGLRGAQVLTGRCYEGESSVPYRPFVEALRQYARSRPDPDLRAQLGPGAPEVATLISEVRQRFPDIAESPKLEAEAERLRLFDSVTQFLRSASRSQPLVLFLDDLHWADKPSLLLLQHASRHATGDRLMVLATYRDVELDRTHPLSEALSELRRMPGFKRVLVRGLPPDDVEDLLRAMDPSEEGAPGRHLLAMALHQETEGNPFFIREVLAHLVETGKIVREGGRWVGRVQSVSELGIPEGVREVIGRRLSRLSEGCNRMLTRASAMTRGFAWDALKAICAEPETELLEELEEALAAQLIAERRETPGTYDFTHALIRQTLYGELSTPRRVILHREVAAALEKLYAGSLDQWVSELAHHFYQAAPGGDVDKAIDYARKAGDRAVSLLAYEEAGQQYALALQAYELRDRPDDRLRCELLLGLGSAQDRAGDPEKAASTLEKAMEIADGIKSPDLMGVIALAHAQAMGRGSQMFTDAGADLVERALAAVGDTDDTLRGRLLVALAFRRFIPSDPIDETVKMLREAEAIGERLGDAHLRATALNGLHGVLAGPQFTEQRVAMAPDAIRLAEAAGETALVLQAHSNRMIDALELGDIETVDAELGMIYPLADETREPWFLGVRPFWDAMRAIMQGHLAEGEQKCQQAFAHGQRFQNPIIQNGYGVQLYSIRLQQGRTAEMEPLLRRLIEQTPTLLAWLPALALGLMLSGKEEEAREIFERLATDDFKSIPMDAGWLTAMQRLASLATYLNDKPRAALLYEMLLPYRNRNIVIANAMVCDGSASRPLGMLAATMVHWEDAEELFQEAIELNARTGARPNLARAQFEYARMLVTRDATGDRAHALQLLDEALILFQDIGMKRDIEDAIKLKLKTQGISSSDVQTSIDRVAISVHNTKPDLAVHAAPDGTVTIMFSDIEGSTQLTERLGDKAWMEVLREHNAIIREQLKAHDGFEVKSEGDGFMLAFQSAAKALACASAIQQALATRNARVGAPPGDGGGEGGAAPRGGPGTGTPSVEPVRVRMGLHAGEVIKEGRDFFGRNVIMAARVASQAQGGEILASGVLKALLQGSDVTWGPSRVVELKGLSGEHEIWAVNWSQ